MTKAFSSKVSGFLAGPGGIGGAIGGALAGASVVAGVAYAVKQFEAVEQATTKLAASLKATGGQAGVTVGQVTALAAQLQGTTRFAATATMEAGAALSRFGQVKGPNFQETIKQAQNYASAMGKDLVGATNELGHALQNPREGYLELASAGVRFSESQIDSIQSLQEAGDVAGAQRVILEALAAQFDGAAEAAGNTFAGKMEILTNTFHSSAAAVGEALAPSLQVGVEKITAWVAQLDKAKIASVVWEYTAKGVGYVLDAVQALTIAWKGAQVAMDTLLLVGIVAFEKLAKAIEWAINGLRKLAGMKELSSNMKDLEQFRQGLEKTTKDDLAAFNKAVAEPWQHTKTDKFFADLKAQGNEAKAAMEQTGAAMGSAITKGPVAAMKQLTDRQIEAQKAATDLIRDLELQNKYYGLSESEKKARELGDKGATAGQVAQVRKLSAQLEGKKLAESLETPFEHFEREMRKLSELRANGGIDDATFARAQTKLRKELQSSIPEVKASAGGALSAYGTEARSAILNYRSASRAANPQEQLKRVAEMQVEEQRLTNVYMRDLVKASPSVAQYAGI